MARTLVLLCPRKSHDISIDYLILTANPIQIKDIMFWMGICFVLSIIIELPLDIKRAWQMVTFSMWHWRCKAKVWVIFTLSINLHAKRWVTVSKWLETDRLHILAILETKETAKRKKREHLQNCTIQMKYCTYLTRLKVIGYSWMRIQQSSCVIIEITFIS